jgi:polygalacturonase
MEEKSMTPEASIYAGLPFDMPRVQEPVFPDNKVSIVDFGAIGDGRTLNTEAFAAAIEAVSKKGGGRVIVPRGIWLTGPVQLKSNINLHTEAGALVRFSTDFDHYPLVDTYFEGLSTFRCASPINGRTLENIAITGEGVFDGSGDAWRFVKKSKMTSVQWKKLIASGGVLNEKGDIWYPSAQSLRGAEMSDSNVPTFKTKEEHEAIRDFLRPVLLSLIDCKKVLIDGPTFQNSPAWCLHPFQCEDVTIRNISVRNPWYSQNGDGLDLESCKNVVLYNSTFDVGDDAICIKSGKGREGRDRGVPTENVIVKNCTVYHGHGGFTVGSEMSGGVKNIHVTGCNFMGTDVGLRFKSTRGRGGVVQNIYISNILMTDIPAEPLLFNLYYSGNSPVPEGDEPVLTAEQKAELLASIPPITEETPSFRDIYIKDVVCRGAGRAALLQGLPEMNLLNIHMENIKILDAQEGLYCLDADGIQMKNVTIETHSGPAVLLQNAKNIDIAGLSFTENSAPPVKILGSFTENIRLRKTDFSDPVRQVHVMHGLDREAIQMEK